MKEDSGTVTIELTDKDIIQLISDPNHEDGMKRLIRATIEDEANVRLTEEQLTELTNKVYNDIRRQSSACQEAFTEL